MRKVVTMICMRPIRGEGWMNGQPLKNPFLKELYGRQLVLAARQRTRGRGDPRIPILMAAFLLVEYSVTIRSHSISTICKALTQPYTS